jgi:hypothetical protein
MKKPCFNKQQRISLYFHREIKSTTLGAFLELALARKKFCRELHKKLKV